MKAIAQLHTQYVNRTYNRTGSLWEGRYRSCLVQAEDYLLACYAYAAGNLTTPHHEFLRLGPTDSERGAHYQELVNTLDASRIEEIRAATNGNFALGSSRFQQEMSAALGRRVTRAAPGRPRSSRDACDQLNLPIGK